MASPSTPGGGAAAAPDGTFDAFSLAPGAQSSPMPSLSSIQQEQHDGAGAGFDSLPSPEELQGPIGGGGEASRGGSWPPPPPAAANSNLRDVNSAGSGTNPSFLGKIASSGGKCSIDALRPYFDVDTADVWVRMKGSLRYVLVADGFRNEVLYSDNAMRLAYRETGNAGEEGEGAGSADASSAGESAPSAYGTASSSAGKGADLYGPIWITWTLVFFVAVTSNISMYLHHKTKTSIVDEGGTAAEEEFEYSVDQLLHATWILYTFSVGLPTLLYFVLRLAGVNGLGLADLVCLYGYSLVPFLPVTWLCIVPLNWLKWIFLAISTALSGLLVLRNTAGPILESTGGGGGGVGAKGGPLIMCLLGCHVVFFLVLKLVFYHHA
ncbi:hypothetical protein ACHAXT_013114 [Thalassiosira profunda]